MDGRIKEVIRWIDDHFLSNQIEFVDLYTIQLACCDERVPAGHAIVKYSVPNSKQTALGTRARSKLRPVYAYVHMFSTKHMSKEIN